MRRARHVDATGKSIPFSGIVSSRQMKNILLYRNENPAYIPCIPRRHEGTKRVRHGTLARVAMDVVASVRVIAWTRRSQRTAKSCGPGAATLASIRPACAGLATVTIKAAHRGEHEVSRKAIARGKPGCLGCSCQTRVRSLYPLHTVLRAQSAPGFPCALFSKEGQRDGRTRANQVAGMYFCVSAPA